MRIKMNRSMPVTTDGVTTLHLEEGDELSVGAGVGADLVEAGHAKSLDPELEQKDAGDADENKDAGDADESKQPKPEKKPRTRRRASK